MIESPLRQEDSFSGRGIQTGGQQASHYPEVPSGGTSFSLGIRTNWYGTLKQHLSKKAEAANLEQRLGTASLLAAVSPGLPHGTWILRTALCSLLKQPAVAIVS